MNKNVANSGSSSGVTSGEHPAHASDSAYLCQQAEDAQAAVKQALEDLKGSLARGVDVRVWAREHPLGMAVLATAAGFAMAGAAIPSKRQQELKRWVAMERAAAAVNGNGKAADEVGGGSSFLSSLGKEILAIARPAIVGMVSSAVASYQQRDDPPDEEKSASVP